MDGRRGASASSTNLAVCARLVLVVSGSQLLVLVHLLLLISALLGFLRLRLRLVIDLFLWLCIFLSLWFGALGLVLWFGLLGFLRYRQSTEWVIGGVNQLRSSSMTHFSSVVCSMYSR
jgi:hypothetical protein